MFKNSIFLRPIFIFFFFCLSLSFSMAASWQQKAEYKMDIDLDVNTHKFMGSQLITYYNNSPDTLDRIYYHLYFNAFQPNSMMDIRTRNIADPDLRILSRLPFLADHVHGHHVLTRLRG